LGSVNYFTGNIAAHVALYSSPKQKGKVTWHSGAPTDEVPSNFASKQEWNNRPFLKNHGHNTENYNIQVSSKKINKNQHLIMVSQTVTVDGKTKQTLFDQYPNKIKKK